jgi:transposase-like protein
VTDQQFQELRDEEYFARLEAEHDEWEGMDRRTLLPNPERKGARCSPEFSARSGESMKALTSSGASQGTESITLSLGSSVGFALVLTLKFRVKCKHQFAVEFSRAVRKAVEVRKVEPINAEICVHCGANSLMKWGVRHNESGDIQESKCKTCGKFFTINVGFEGMKHSPKAITTAMQLYFSGESLRNTQRSLALFGVKVAQSPCVVPLVLGAGARDQLQPVGVGYRDDAALEGGEPIVDRVHEAGGLDGHPLLSGKGREEPAKLPGWQPPLLDERTILLKNCEMGLDFMDVHSDIQHIVAHGPMLVPLPH